MLDVAQLDPLGSLVTEGKASATLASLVSGRIRGFEPKPETRDSLGDLTYEGDALGPGHYKAFVVIAALDVPPHPSVPITFATYVVRAYGTTAQNAWAVWGAVVQTFHKVRGRMGNSGLGMYQTSVISGGEEDKDPETDQPVVLGTIQLIATLSAIA